MPTPDSIEELRARGLLSEAQANILAGALSGRPFSLYSELRALLYAGILALLAGISWTIRDHFARLGHIAIIGSLALTALAAFVYCFLKAPPYSHTESESPSLGLDYLLYFGCALYSLLAVYLETQFHLIGDFWPYYLLVSALIFLGLAYRFDNRLVLAVALATLAAYFGFQLSGWGMIFATAHRLYAIAYGLLVLSLGALFAARSVKKHFFDIYANFAAHFLFLAALSGTFQYGLPGAYFPLLLLLCAGAAAYSTRTGSFLYLLYAMLYGYLGITIIFLKYIHQTGLIYCYFVLSPLLVAYLTYLLYASSRKSKVSNEPVR